VRAQGIARFGFGQRRLAVRAQEYARALAGGGGNAHERVLDQCLAACFVSGEIACKGHYGFHLRLLSWCVGLRRRRAKTAIAAPDLTSIRFMVTLFSLD